MSADGSVKRNRIQLNSDFAEITHGIVGGQGLKEMAQKEGHCAAVVGADANLTQDAGNH